MKISLGCDEAAYQLKETIKQHLQEAGHEVIDNGVGEGEVELYPDVAVRTCKTVLVIEEFLYVEQESEWQ